MRRSVYLMLAGLLWLAACTAPKETAVVTERASAPVKPPSTENAVPNERPAAAVAAAPVAVAGRFDGGKMWTFDNPPLDYFEEAYGFRPDDAWLMKARLGALRFATYCSASFVSPRGLVMTNHHCARESITEVSEEGEELLDEGFYAVTTSDERKVKDLFVDQLIAIEDVTEKVYEGVGKVVGDDLQTQRRERQAEAVEKRMTDTVKAQDSTMYVQVVELYNGGKYSAYTFHRYDDVRLVMAPELQIGYFGGDPDNFTYPRYNLDMSFFRVYGPGGEPLVAEHFFPFSAEGVKEGDAVFVVGNPGSTSRLSTVSQLAYARDYDLPQGLAVMRDRAALLDAYIKSHPKEAEAFKLRNPYFSLMNSIKANAGQLEGLQDPYLIARRKVAEDALSESVMANDSLRRLYGDVLTEIAQIQSSKRASARKAGALTGFLNGGTGSHILIRAMYGYVYSLLKQRGAPSDQLEEIRKEAMKIEDWPAELEKVYITARLQQLRDYLGPEDPTMKAILGDRAPSALAAEVVDSTALIDSTGFKMLLDDGYLGSGDATVPLINAIAPLYFTLNQQLENFEEREQSLNARLARARFAVSGLAAPPDASFSLRLSDGRVKGYFYNGTKAPPFTTFYGLYGHYYSYIGREEWALPERWLQPPPAFDLSTPVNLVSTNDITGGNSGSPLLNQNLEVVGLVFDGNIESLPNEYLFRDEAGRTVSVDVRGILEVLDDIYDADRLVLELRDGKYVATEAEADALSSD